MSRKGKMIFGWEEWCSLPKLNLPIIKAKIDSGAKTSCLHAVNIKAIRKGEKRYIDFDIHPIQKNKKIVVRCRAPRVDKRSVKSSTGHKEKRYVISTPISIGNKCWDIEITLTNRDSMGYRMLIGREAMKGMALIDPERSFLQKELENKKAKEFYIKGRK